MSAQKSKRLTAKALREINSKQNYLIQLFVRYKKLVGRFVRPRVIEKLEPDFHELNATLKLLQEEGH